MWSSAITTDPNSLSFGQLDLWSVLLKDAVIYQVLVVDKWLWSSGAMILTGPNWNTWRKRSVTVPLSPTQIPHAVIWHWFKTCVCEMTATNSLGHGTAKQSDVLDTWYVLPLMPWCDTQEATDVYNTRPCKKGCCTVISYSSSSDLKAGIWHEEKTVQSRQ